MIFPHLYIRGQRVNFTASRIVRPSNHGEG